MSSLFSIMYSKSTIESFNTKNLFIVQVVILIIIFLLFGFPKFGISYQRILFDVVETLFKNIWTSFKKDLLLLQNLIEPALYVYKISSVCLSVCVTQPNLLVHHGMLVLVPLCSSFGLSFNRGCHSVSSTVFCFQCLSPSDQLPSYPPSLHPEIFSLISLFFSFPVTPLSSPSFLNTPGLLMTYPYQK